MRSRLLAVLLLPAALGACNDILPANDGKTGFVALTTYDNGAGGFALSPLGAFYGRSDLAFVPPQLDACQDIQYSTTGQLPSTRSLDAGPRVLTVLPTRQDTLLPEAEFGLILYRSPLTAGIPHVPGDSITVIVPGGPGFPAASARLKTAESFTHDPVTVPAQGDPLVVRWQAAPSSDAIMALSLRYADLNSTGLPNRQVFCAFIDDGEYAIPFFVINGWAAATSGSRETVFSRIRVREVQVAGDVRFTVTSSFDRPTPLLQP